MRLSGSVKLIFLILIIVLVTSCGGGGSGSSDNNNNSFTNNNPGNSNNNNNNNNNNNYTLSGETFLALYLVGSDLESDGEAGTTDLLEMIKGYESLSDAERSNIYVYVAFGGANKDGWRGVKYANMDCIIKDSKDKIFGNDNCYDYVQEISPTNAKNMSHPEAFEHFINKVKTLSGNFNTKFLILWNHGGAYKGYGWDENWREDGNTLDKDKKSGIGDNDKLTIYEIRDVLKKVNLKFDVIGFDACLMANLEVASALKNFANYLLAAEEVEPGHGWHYTDVIQILAKNPNDPILERTKRLVDNFINNKEHDIGSGLTLSIIDLSKIDDLLTAIDNINFNTLDLDKIVTAEKLSQKYGFSIDGNTLEESYFTIDMIQFFEKAGLTDIVNKAKNVVVYTKDDGSIISNGISMASFTNIIELISQNDVELKTKEVLPSNYFSNLEKLYNLLKSDNTKPQIGSPYNCTYEGNQGVCYDIVDNETAIESVGIYVLIPGQGIYYLSSYDYLPKISQNKYFLDVNKYLKVYMFCNGNCNASPGVFAPLYFLYQTPKNELVYITPASTIINNKTLKGYLILRIDPSKGSGNIYFSFSPTSKIRLIVGEHIDEIIFEYLILDSYGNVKQQSSQPINFSNGIDIVEYQLGGSSSIIPVMLIEAADVAGNSEFVQVPLP